MSLSETENYIEALIFASENGIPPSEIKQTMEGLTDRIINEDEIESAIWKIKKKYEQADTAIELVSINGAYQFLTRKEYHPVINQLHLQRSKKKLSQAGLETLAIIAYKQPVTKLEIEQIRGVSCDYSIQKLLEKELISIAGKADTVGRPLLYGVSNSFMDYFGINSAAQLPHLKDLIEENNEIGEPAS